jgi:hypothetical protein
MWRRVGSQLDRGVLARSWRVEPNSAVGGTSVASVPRDWLMEPIRLVRGVGHVGARDLRPMRGWLFWVN